MRTPPPSSVSFSYSSSKDDRGPYPLKLPVFERPKSDPTPIGFQGYVVNTEEPILGFHHIVIAYCVLAFVLLYPFVTCGRYYRANVMAKKDNCEEKHEGVITSPPGSDLMPGDATAAAAAHANANAQSTVIQSTSNMKDVRGAESSVRPQERADVDVDQQQEEDPATPTSSSKSSVEEDPEKPISEAASTPPAERSTRDRANASASAGTNTKMQRPFGSQVASSTGLSRIPSAATTGLLYARSSRSSGAWPRQKHSRRPTGVPSWQWKRAIQTERRHHMRQLSHQSGTTNSAWRLKKSGAVGAMSDLANSVLDAEMTCPKETTISQNHKMMDSYSGGAETALYSHTALARRQRQRRESFNGSTRSGSVRSDYYRYPPSVMSSIVDDITPNDAADANDPGKVKAFDQAPPPRTATSRILSATEPWLDVAEPDEELKRLLSLASNMTMGSLLEPLSRCFMLAIISHWVGTHAMVAYLLVQLSYRLTGETLSVAITDAESTLVQMVLTDTSKLHSTGNTQTTTFSKEGYQQAGQYVQLACWLQLLVVGPVLVLWYLFIEDAVLWWVDSTSMALLAKEYFQVIVYLFLVQSLYRSIMVPCHIRGSSLATWETLLDLITTAATLITVPVVLSNISDDVDEDTTDDGYTIAERLDNSRTALSTVGWVQVNIGAAACIIKLAFCVLKGMMDHFRVLRSAAFLNFSALCNLLLNTLPLVIGSILEFGEVDLLTIFVRHLGPAEVGAWAIIASIWDVLQASTEGISEAAAIRIAYHLSASEPGMAKKLARKVLYWTSVVSLSLSAILLLSGRHLIVALTVDYTLQHLLDNQVGLLALANLSLGFGQVCWSLIGAQGKFNLATLVVLACRWAVTMPLSLAFIYALNYDEEALAGAVAVGSSTAACALAFVLFSSDWNDVAQDLFMKGLLSCEDDDDFDFEFDEDDDEDDDSSDGSSFAMGGFPSTKKEKDHDDHKVKVPQVTEPTARTNTVTGSHTNTGSHSGIHSGHSGLHSSNGYVSSGVYGS